MTRNKIIEISKRYFMASPMGASQPRSWSVYDRAQRQTESGVKFGPIGATFKKVFDNGSKQDCRNWVERNGEEEA